MPPATRGATETFVICTSAEAVTAVVALAVLFDVFVSLEVGPTLAVRTIDPGCG